MDRSFVLVIVVAFFLVMFGIGYWANRKTKSAAEFLVAGQSLGFFVMAIATFSSAQSGWGMVGSTGTTYAWGPQALLGSALLVPLGFALAWFLLGARLQRVARRHQVYSVPDLVKIRYDSRHAHLAMSVAMFLGSVAYMTAQVTATGVIMSLLLGTSIETGAWIGSAIVAAYTIAGGMLAAVWTDLVQGVLMIVMSLGLFMFAAHSAGGWSTMLSTLGAADVALVSIDGVKPMAYIIGFTVMILFGAAGQPHLLTKFLMLSDTKELKWGATVAGIAYGVTTLFSLGIGLSVRAMSSNGSAPKMTSIDNTATWFLDNVTGQLVGGLALTAVLAAIMSSASSFITIGASSIVRDLAGGLGIVVRRELLWSRVASGFVVLASLLLALYLSEVIFLLGAIGWAAFGAAIFGPLVIGLYWKRATAAATTVTIGSGLAFNLATTVAASRGWITLPSYFYLGGIVVAGSIVLFVVVSLLTSPRSGSSGYERLYGDAAALDR